MGTLVVFGGPAPDNGDHVNLEVDDDGEGGGSRSRLTPSSIDTSSLDPSQKILCSRLEAGDFPDYPDERSHILGTGSASEREYEFAKDPVLGADGELVEEDRRLIGFRVGSG